MAISRYSIFWAIIIELIVIYLAIAFKHDKRKVVAVLIIGTLLAGIVGSGLFIHPREDPTPFPNDSFPNVEATESISPMQIAQKLDTIHTFKAHGTITRTSEGGKTFVDQVKQEFARPDKQYLIIIYESGEIEESIAVGDQFCWRHGQQNEWLCSDRHSYNPVQEWSWIVRAKANPGTTLIDYGIRAYTWHNKKCRLYYKTEVSSDPLDDWGQSTTGVCIDPDTLLPVEYFSSDTQGAINEFDVFDINEPIDISLPVQ